MKIFGTIHVILALCVGVSITPSLAEDVRGVKLIAYSALSFIETEGEYYGVEVIFIPYSDGEKVVWRSGSGQLDRPILLDAVKEGGVVKIVVPESNPFHGEWTLTVKGRHILAAGPGGLSFDLEEIVNR